MKVSEILAQKGREVFTVRAAETLGTLAHRLRLANVGALVVSEDGARLDGVVSERDVVRALADRGPRATELTVGDVMTRRVATCSPDSTLAELVRTITVRRVRHLPVIDGGRVVGVVSIGDVLKQRLDEMEMESSVLRDLSVAAH